MSEQGAYTEGGAPRYPMNELVYASDLEKAYGVSDEAYRYYCDMQRRLRRFDTFPTLSAEALARAGKLMEMRDWLRAKGFNPTEEDNVFEVARIDFVHSTAALEGSTLTVFEVAQILQEGATIPGYDFRQHQEIDDIDRSFSAMVDAVRHAEPLSLDLVRNLHALAAAHLDDCEPGELRWDQRYVTGAGVLPPPPGMVRELLTRAVEWYNNAPGIDRATGFHLVFEDIHPFQDGNGRVGRVLVNFMLMSLGFPVISLKPDPESNARYHAVVNEFAKSVGPRSADGLFGLVEQALAASIGRCALKIEQNG